MKEFPNQMLLTNKNPNKGLIVTLCHNDPEVIEQFREACFDNLDRSLNWFHQCNTAGYQMFEFWAGMERLPEIQESCEHIAAMIGMELEIAI